MADEKLQRVIPHDLHTGYRLAKAQLNLCPPVEENDAEEWLVVRFICEVLIALVERIADAEALLREKDQQLHDEALAFNHANEVVGKLEADLAASRQECQQLRKENERLKAPLSDEEWERFSFGVKIVGAKKFYETRIFELDSVHNLLTSRAQQDESEGGEQPASKEKP